MAVNKPFANLDRLSKLATPQVQLPTPSVQQGGTEVNANFANRISLSDRLQQSKLGTTKHLAQYFLSDMFTNYIKIKPTKTLEHTSDVEILLPAQSVVQGGLFPQTIAFSPQQGGELPKAARSSFLYSQAAIEKINGVEVNSIKLSSLTPILDKTLQQGTFYQNAQFFSSVQPEIPPFEMEQGSVDIQNLQTTPQQGSTDSTTPVSVQSITTAQGTIIINGQQTSFIDTSLPLVKRPIEVPYASLSIPTAVQNEVAAATTIPSSIVVNQGWFNGLDWQGKKSFTLIPEQEIQLKTAGYLAKSLAFRVLPTVMQGGNNPTNQLDKDGFAVTWTSHTAVSKLLNAPDGLSLDNGTVISILQRRGASGFQKNSTLVGGGYKNVAVKANDEVKLFVNTDSTSYKSQERQQNVIKLLNRDDSKDAAVDIGKIVTDNTNERSEKFTVNDKYADLMKSTNQEENGNGKRNNTVQQIAKTNIEVTDILSKDVTGATAVTVNNELMTLIKTRSQNLKQRSSFSEENDYETLSQKITQIESGPKSTAAKRPGAKVVVSDYDGTESVVFDAFIKTFSDGVSPAYTDYTHIGQQDTFKVFKGSTRQLSLGLSIYAMGNNPNLLDFENSKLEAKAALQKVDKLMKLCGVGSVVDNYIKAPIVRITIVGLVKGVICACNSVKMDIPITETAWDVDTQIPQSFDVTLDLAVLAMQSDKLLSKDGTFYNV
jgi:hypothetical protein